jgi:hypothetical protein
LSGCAVLVLQALAWGRPVGANVSLEVGRSALRPALPTSKDPLQGGLVQSRDVESPWCGVARWASFSRLGFVCEPNLLKKSQAESSATRISTSASASVSTGASISTSPSPGTGISMSTSSSTGTSARASASASACAGASLVLVLVQGPPPRPGGPGIVLRRGDSFLCFSTNRYTLPKAPL